MWGINLYTGGHFDNYLVRYTSYRAGASPEAAFEKPDLCADKPLLPAKTEGWRHALHAQVASYLPNAYYGAPYALSSHIRVASFVLNPADVSRKHIYHPRAASLMPCFGAHPGQRFKPYLNLRIKPRLD